MYTHMYMYIHVYNTCTKSLMVLSCLIVCLFSGDLASRCRAPTHTSTTSSMYTPSYIHVYSSHHVLYTVNKQHNIMIYVYIVNMYCTLYKCTCSHDINNIAYTCMNTLLVVSRTTCTCISVMFVTMNIHVHCIQLKLIT